MKRLVLLSLILVVFFTSCQNNESKNHADFKKAENGLMYKFYIDNEGDNRVFDGFSSELIKNFADKLNEIIKETENEVSSSFSKASFGGA